MLIMAEGSLNWASSREIYGMLADRGEQVLLKALALGETVTRVFGQMSQGLRGKTISKNPDSD